MCYEDIIETYYDTKDNFVVNRPKIKKDHYDDFESDQYEFNRKYFD